MPFGNPVLRSLNLILLTITLVAVTWRWLPTRKGLVYLTHVTGLLTFASIIDWHPKLNQSAWAAILTIFAGLILRVRAFLFVGTATFLWTAFYQLVILISRYPFIKRVVGLIAGIIFIGMAANFETRREQIKSVLLSSSNQLGEWE
ncbi:MAG: hypothetical protein WBG73_05390 [Coleofasciculaceae cyanobacterium]